MQKEKKNSTKVTGIIIMAVILLILMFPKVLFFIPDSTRATIASASKSIFGKLTSSSPSVSAGVVIKLIVMVLIMEILEHVLNLIIGSVFTRSKRSRTVGGLACNLIKYFCRIVIIVWALSILGVNTTAIFASVGIVSLVVGFGAQSLVEDIITGFFIIFEGQYNVGDVIVLDGFRGTVVDIGVRTTRIMDMGGNVKIVNNSDVRNVQNRSQELSIAICDMSIAYGASIEDAERVILEESKKIKEENKGVFGEDITYVGVQSLDDSSIKLRIVANVKEKEVYNAQRIMNRAFKIAFDENGIEIPFTQIVVHQG